MPYPVHLQEYVEMCGRTVPKVNLPEKFPNESRYACPLTIEAMRIPVTLHRIRYDLDSIFDPKTGKLRFTNHPSTGLPIAIDQIQPLDIDAFDDLIEIYGKELKRQQDEAIRLLEAEQKLKEQPKPHSASEKTGTHAQVVGEDGNLPNDAHPIAISPADCATSVFIPRPIESSSLSQSAGPGVSKSHLNIRVYVLGDESNDASCLVYGLDSEFFIFGNSEYANLPFEEISTRKYDGTKEITYSLLPANKTSDLKKVFQLCIIPVNTSDPHRLEKVERYIKELNEKINYCKTLIILAVINATKPRHISELEKFLNQSSLAAEVVSICPVNGDKDEYRAGVFDPLIEQMNKAANIYQASNDRFHSSSASSSVSCASAAPSASVAVATSAVGANPASEHLDLNKRLDVAPQARPEDRFYAEIQAAAAGAEAELKRQQEQIAQISSIRELRDYPVAVAEAVLRSHAYKGVKDHFGGEINVISQGYAFYYALDRQAYCLAVMTRTYQIQHIELHVLLDCVAYTDETFRYSTFTETVNRTLTNHADLYNFTKEPNIIKVLFSGVKEDFIGRAVDRTKLALTPSAASSLAASPAVVSSSSSSSVLATGKPIIVANNFPTCPDDAIRLAIQNSPFYLGVRNKEDRPEFVLDNGYAFYINSKMNVLCIAYRIKDDVETKTLIMDSLIATTSYVNGKLQLHAVKGGSEKDIEFLTQVLNPLFKGVKTDFNKSLAQGKATSMAKSFSNWFWLGSSSANSNSVAKEKASLSSVKTVEQTIRVCVIGSTPKGLIKRMCKNYHEYSSYGVTKVTDPTTATIINYEVHSFQQERFKPNSQLTFADLYILAIDGTNYKVSDQINNYLEAIDNNVRSRDEKVIIALTQADKGCAVDIKDLEKIYLNPKSTSRVVSICPVDEKSSFGFNELLTQMNSATRQQTPATAPARSLAP